MERGNTKHGPAHDQEMAHETEGMVRGSANRARGEEWRETEPVEVAVPPAGRRFASPHDVMEALGINSPETNR